MAEAQIGIKLGGKSFLGNACLKGTWLFTRLREWRFTRPQLTSKNKVRTKIVLACDRELQSQIVAFQKKLMMLADRTMIFSRMMTIKICWAGALIAYFTCNATC